ncbi:aminoacyl-tRNA hydrolase [Ilumatobacter sp.]|uniref:aminoacyl-tRNA hydrolase n=1 Tax=Ilumatobacter sp. TaxID=1967498 RepID=UPI003AF82805
MGLFDRRAGKGAPFDWLVVGLGNPGPKYERTRHNVGEECVRLLAERHDAPLKAGRDNSLTGEARFTVDGEIERAALAFPLTFMNESGRAVSSLVRRYRIESPEQIIVVQDELDLEPGVVKLKNGGGLAGHNGLRSIAQHLRSQDFLRVRIGVGKPPSKERGAGHVLNKIPRREREVLDVAVAVAADAVELIIAEGIEAAMHDIHGR